jgi:hypothetical protein
MLPSPNQAAKRAGARSRIVAGYVSVVGLGLLALCWWNGSGLQIHPGVANVSAAEPLPTDEGAAADDLSDLPGGAKTTRASQSDAQPIEYFPRPTKDEAKILAALEKPTSLEFVDTPLEMCFAFLKDYHKVNIWLDRQTLTDEAVALDQPITLKLAGVTLRSVLKLLLEPVQLTYVVEDGVMKITTSAKANDRLVTRTYPVHDLYHPPGIAEDQPFGEKGAPRRVASEPRPGDLETAIARTIDPDSWDNKNGPGSMTYVRQSGSLVIRQTPSAHEEILQLLRDLREAKRMGQGAAARPAARGTGWQLRGPRRAETYSLVGIMDLDGDGEGDSGRLHEVIKAAGARIDNEVDEEGVLRVDGSIPDDGLPRITEKTKFVVVGRIPQVADTADPDEIATILKVAGFLKDLEDRARTHGVRIVRLADFLEYLGYEPVESRTTSSRLNPPPGR